MYKKNANCLTKKVKLFAAVLDGIYAIIKYFSKRKKEIPKKFDRILLSNWASLGDLLLATSVIPAIKAQYPQAKIGFLVSKSSKIVLETCPGIDWIHEVDTWATLSTRWKKIKAFLVFTFRHRKKIIEELKEKQYDCALELYSLFPNTIPFLWAAKIPLIVGFNSGGNSCLLDFSVDWKGDRYLPFLYSQLLEKIGVRQSKAAIPIHLPPQPSLSLKKPYLLFHPCSSSPSKEFPVGLWKALYSFCVQKGIHVYFTGRGGRERERIEAISSEGSLCDRLRWPDLAKAIRESAGIVTVDSVPAHLAWALHTPFAVLYQKQGKMWQPESTRGSVFGVNRNVCSEEVKKVIADWIQIAKGEEHVS